MKRLLRRLVPQTLAGQVIALSLLALLLAQAVSVVLLADERRQALRSAQQEQVLARVATIVRVIEQAPPPVRPRILESASTREIRFWLAPESAVPPGAGAPVDRRLAERFLGRLGMEPRDLRVDIRKSRGLFGWDGHHGHRPLSLTLAMPLTADAGGSWLNVRTQVPPPRPDWAPPLVIALVLSAVLISLVIVLTVRRATRPLSRLADAAEAFGRGANAEPLDSSRGPAEVQRTTQAFNEMQERIRRFVDDRMKMLAAISHDLRTPLTALRLRAEMVDDEETRRRMLATLAEMEEMVEATLAFARAEAVGEARRRLDLTALAAAVADEAAEGGGDVTLAEDAPRLVVAGRQGALKRALRNVVQNAVQYAGAVQISLEQAGGRVSVLVCDDGPGIPEEALARVFEPFVRLEESRSRDTGGIGLGLAIARTVLRAHGGDVELANRPEGGLQVRLWLPAEPAAGLAAD